jgi:acyl-CoA hydrolase
MVFVALDEQGKPTPVPVWEPQTEGDRHLAAYATTLRGVRDELDAGLDTA